MSATDYHLIPECMFPIHLWPHTIEANSSNHKDSRMSVFERVQMFNDGFSPSTDPSQFPAAAKIFLAGIAISPENEQEMIAKVRKLLELDGKTTEGRSKGRVWTQKIRA